MSCSGPAGPPALLNLYRDPVKPGAEAAYRAVEEDAARICAELKCPNPHVAIESVAPPIEVWWLTELATDAEKERVVKAYAQNRPLLAALEGITKRKQDLTTLSEELLTQHRPEESRGRPWSLAGARFVVAAVTRGNPRLEGSVFEAPDGRKFVLRPVRTRAEADALVPPGDGETRIFAVRPYWGMPAPEWVAADPEFWKPNPASNR